MFYQLLNRKKEINRYKVSFKNPFNLTCEKITQTPRIYTTSQITTALENTIIEEIESKDTPKLLTKVLNYILKDFFLYMHQTGLYNRQFKLWRTLGNIKQILISRPVARFLKNKELSFYLIELSIDEIYPAISAVLEENDTNVFKEFKNSLSWILSNSNVKRLKGLLYFSPGTFNSVLTEKFSSVISSVSNPIARYESIINETKDVRLNVINHSKLNDSYKFVPVFPPVRVHQKINEV